MYYTGMYMSFSVTVALVKSTPSSVPILLISACNAATPLAPPKEALSNANVCSVLLLPSGPSLYNSAKCVYFL